MSGSVFARLADALGDAYKRRSPLAQMLEYRLSKNLDDIVGDRGMKEVIFELLVEARSSGWLDDLIVSARAARPDNIALHDVAAELKLAPRALDGAGLERIVRKGQSFLDPAQFRARLAAAEAAVCMIETPAACGTGFLIGPDLVLTNYHVLSDVLTGAIEPASVRVRFDFRRWQAPGRRDGAVTSLADDWRLDDSPFDDGDLADPPTAPDPDHLDYALIRIARRLGEEPVGAQAEPGASMRGWLTGADHDFPTESPLFIVQHPLGKPMSLALDTSAIIAMNAERTRVRYRTNTEKGSSGAPCFDGNWRLVALHHAGDPAWHAQFNQGIPIMRVVERLRRRAIDLPAPP